MRNNRKKKKNERANESKLSALFFIVSLNQSSILCFTPPFQLCQKENISLLSLLACDTV
jgi:hypothetical protein